MKEIDGADRIPFGFEGGGISEKFVFPFQIQV